MAPSSRRDRFAKRVGRFLLPCVLFAAVIATSDFAGAQEPLRWKLKSGERLLVDWTQRVETESAIGDKPLKLVVDSQFEMTWNVEKVDDAGTATVSQSLRRLKVRVDLPPADPLEFDSESDAKLTGDSKGLAETLRPLVGPTWRMELSSRGELKSVTPSPELTAAMEKGSVNGRLKQWFANAQDGGFLKALFVALPEGAVAPGATWTQSQENKTAQGPVVVTSKHTLREPAEREGRTVAVCDVEGAVKWGDGAENAANRRTLKSQKITGEWTFDNASGKLVDSRQHLSLVTETRVRESLLEVRVTSVSTLKIRGSTP